MGKVWIKIPQWSETVIPRFQPQLHYILNDVNNINKSWCGAEGKGPTMDLVFYVSAIKIDVDGYRAS